MWQRNRCTSKVLFKVWTTSKRIQQRNSVQNNSGSFTLTINRAKQWFAINPAVKVVVDANTEYKIDNGATLNIPVSAGTHNIAFSCSMRNKIVNVNVADNVTLNIKWNRVTGSLEVE